MFSILFILQLIIFLFLILHDLVPLGRFNDVRAVKEYKGIHKTIRDALINGIPYGFLVLVFIYVGHGTYPLWAKIYTLLVYSLYTLGILLSWYIPYFFGASEKRKIAYQKQFHNTITFLPWRNGITVNALHVIYHCLHIIAFISICYWMF
jgi:hypothetical protein